MRAWAAVVAALPALAALSAPAALSFQQPPAEIGPPVFVPWTGENLGDELPSRITVQNLGAEEMAYLVVHFPSEGEPGCPACRALSVQCSPTVLPGTTWSASDWTDGPDGRGA